MPKFKVEQVEDAYVVYVNIVGISEDVFWNAPISILKTIMENKNAYDGWLSATRQKMQERRR